MGTWAHGHKRCCSMQHAFVAGRVSLRSSSSYQVPPLCTAPRLRVTASVLVPFNKYILLLFRGRRREIAGQHVIERRLGVRAFGPKRLQHSVRVCSAAAQRVCHNGFVGGQTSGAASSLAEVL